MVKKSIYLNKKFLLIPITILVVFLSFNMVSAANHTVNGNSTTDYDNVNDWLSSGANDGDSLIFDIDQCNWELKINKSIKVISNKNTKFVGSGVGNGFSGPIGMNITANNVYVSGFIFTNYYSGIWSNSSKLTILNNTFSDNYYGIQMYRRDYFSRVNISDITIENNKIMNSLNRGVRIYADKISNLIVNNNNISNNNDTGFYCDSYSLNNALFSKNIFNNNGGDGISISANSGDNITASNNLANNNRYAGIIIHRCSALIYNNTANNNGNIGIQFYSSDNCTVIGNTANNNNFSGIHFSGFSINGHIIMNNTLNNNDYWGIYMLSGGDGVPGFIFDNVIGNNTISNNGGGIHILTSSVTNSTSIYNNTIELNKIINNTDYGIMINTGSDRAIAANNTINQNIIKNSSIGIYVNRGESNNFLSNNITSNDQGIFLNLSNKDTIKSNNIVNNKVGISFLNVNKTNITYNRVFNNSEALNITDVNNIIANLNWWGNNTPKTDYENVTIDSWYVLELSADEFTTIKNASKHFNDRYGAILSYYLSTNIPVDHDPSQLPYFLVTVIGPNGEKTTADIRNTNISYYVEGKGPYTIQALSDAEDVLLSVTFLEKPEPPIPPTPPKPPKPIPDKNETINTPNAHASMKQTGIPIIAILILLISSLGLIYRKK